MRGLASRMARLEDRRPYRVVVAAVPPGSSLEAVAKAHGFLLHPSDMLVTIAKPEGCAAGRIVAYGGRP